MHICGLTLFLSGQRLWTCKWTTECTQSNIESLFPQCHLQRRTYQTRTRRPVPVGLWSWRPPDFLQVAGISSGQYDLLPLPQPTAWTTWLLHLNTKTINEKTRAKLDPKKNRWTKLVNKKCIVTLYGTAFEQRLRTVRRYWNGVWMPLECY